jgi:hypothetical protein
MRIRQEKLKVSLGMKLFWCLVVLVFFSLGFLSYLSKSFTGYVVCWILTAFFIILALALTPRRLTSHDDEMEIKLWLGHTVTIPADNIRAVRKLSKSSVFLSQDVPLKSSWSIPVQVVRKKGSTLVLTPLNPDKFVAEVSKLIGADSPGVSGQPAPMK